MLSDPLIARMLTATACLAVIIAVLAIAIRVLMDGLGPQLGEMTDALVKIATGGGLLTIVGLLGGRLVEQRGMGGNSNATDISK